MSRIFSIINAGFDLPFLEKKAETTKLVSITAKILGSYIENYTKYVLQHNSEEYGLDILPYPTYLVSCDKDTKKSDDYEAERWITQLYVSISR